MKPNSLPSVLFLAMATILLTTCQKPSRDNPYDDLAKLDPQEWAPKNLLIEAPGITERTITWVYNGDSRIEGFKIDRKKGNDNWVLGYAKLEKDSRSLTDTISPDLNTTYYYKVYSYAGAVKSNELESNAPAAIPAPSDLTLEKINDVSYKLNWNDNATGESGFIIERKTTGPDFIVLDTTSANSTSYIDPNVFTSKAPVNVQYQVKAFYGRYTSDFSESNTNALLIAPNNLQIIRNSIHFVTLTWNDNSNGEEGFIIERKHNNNDWEIISNQTLTTLNDSSFNFNSEVYYRVSAYVKDYQSDYVLNSFISKIPEPSNVQIFRNSVTELTIQWLDNSNGEDGFRIERKHPNSDWILIAEQSQTYFIDNSFEMNTAVEYRISSFYDSISSDYLIVQFNSLIRPPTITVLDYLENNSVKISWITEYSGYTSFTIDRKLNTENYFQNFIYVNNPSQSSVIDTSIDLELGKYTYRIIAHFNEYNSLPSNEIIASAQLGMHLFGGYIFYFNDNNGGLVAGVTDISNSSQWGCLGNSILGTSKNLGTGLSNSTLILDGCPSNQIAAGLCLNFTDGEFNDWYLPSLYELELVYIVLKQNNIGNFRDSNYWSSSQTNSLKAFTIDFSNGNDSSWEKNYGLSTRAIRSFSF